jgi:hypothetical protein
LGFPKITREVELAGFLENHEIVRVLKIAKKRPSDVPNRVLFILYLRTKPSLTKSTKDAVPW